MHWLLTCSGLMLLGLSLPEFSAPDKDWNAKVREIAKTYEKFGRVDKQYRWSPIDCESPGPRPPALHFSKNESDDTHGQKLYTVFAKKVQWDEFHHLTGFPRTPTYLPPYLKDQLGKGRAPSEVGQVIVKEAWEPVKTDFQKRQKDAQSKIDRNDPRFKVVTDPQDKTQQEWRQTVYDHGDALIPYAEKNGQQYKAGERTGLFIMFKEDPKTAGTDQGWVYATVAKDLKTVTAVGVIASCARCHQEAKHDRLFGLK